MRSGIKIQYDDAEIGEPMETKLNSMFRSGMGPDLIGYGIMSAPILGALAVLKFTAAWNEYTWPLVMTNAGADTITTVQLALTRFRNEGEIFWNQLMAATMVSRLI